MGKTTDLRGVITAQLNTLSGGTYYRMAPADATMPYKVFSLSRVALQDYDRDDFELTIDLWNHAKDTKVLDELADSIESLLSRAVLPQANILPVFYRSNRYTVDDSDRDIQHLQITFDVQMYERGTNNNE